MDRAANILDPIHPTLPSDVWDHPATTHPKIKGPHKAWIWHTVTTVLERHGYHQSHEWLKLVLTGSLTTYQYTDNSDCDISLFVSEEQMPEWSRGEMIGLMVGNVDGTILPGTPYKMQCFVVGKKLKPHDLYKSGLRAGYDLKSDTWIEPPDPTRSLDIEKQRNEAYVYALECADKMERLLRYEPDKAIEYWHQIHQARQRAQKEGRGDFSLPNIVYKFLANRGLMPELSELTGEYIAKTSKPIDRQVAKFVYDPFANRLILGQMGKEEGEHLSHPQLLKVGGIDPDRAIFGQITHHGWVETFARIKRGTIKGANPYELDHKLKQAIDHTVPGTRFVQPPIEPPHDRWKLPAPPEVILTGEKPVIHSEEVQPTYEDPFKEWDFPTAG